MKLNYTPDKKYPLEISKKGMSWFIYEQDEADPVLSKRFKTSVDAENFARANFPGYKIIVIP